MTRPCMTLAARIKVKSSKSSLGSLVSPILLLCCSNKTLERIMSVDVWVYLREEKNVGFSRKIKMERRKRKRKIMRLWWINDRKEIDWQNPALRQRSMIKRYRMLTIVALTHGEILDPTRFTRVPMSPMNLAIVKIVIGLKFCPG